MTAPITFPPINVPATTDSCDMPHVLGDPADAAWKGCAERVNDNNALLVTYAGQQIAAMDALRRPAAELSGTGVITPASSWATTWAYARTLTTSIGKFVQINVKMTYNGSTYWTSNDLGGTWNSPITMGTLVTALRPTVSSFLLTMTAYCWYKDEPGFGTYQSSSLATVMINTSGTLVSTRPSTQGAFFGKTSYFIVNATYFTGSF